MRKNRVLIITYYWPPAGGPGVQRILKFAKYLPHYGWEPIILTVKNGEYPVIDNSLEKDVPKHCKVFKTDTKDMFSLYRKFTGKSSDEKVPTDLNDNHGKNSLANYIRLNFIFPDARKGWIPEMIKKGEEIIKEFQPKFILATSPPHSVQVGAARLAELTRTKLISDYRDPWMEIVYYQNQKRSFWAKWIDGNLERKTMSSARKIITISDELKDLIASKLDTEKEIAVIPNGFDKDDFMNIKITQRDYFRIVYTGVINQQRIPHALLQVLQNDFAMQIKLEIFGKVCPELVNKVIELNIEDKVIYHDFIPHDEIISEMMNTDILLLVIDDVIDNKGFLTGKLFDYLGCMRPILGIGPADGDAAKILAETDSGMMFDYQDQHGIFDFIKNILQAKNRDEDIFTFDSEEFTRKKLTGKLVELFKK